MAAEETRWATITLQSGVSLRVSEENLAGICRSVASHLSYIRSQEGRQFPASDQALINDAIQIENTISLDALKRGYMGES